MSGSASWKKATEYGWKQTYFIIDDFDIENYVLIPFNKFNEWEKTNLNRKNLNKKTWTPQRLFFLKMIRLNSLEL